MAFDDSTPGQPLTDWPRPLAFVLSGGGAFGPTQVGMLRALEERQVRPDLIVGTSVGALNGALVAADIDGAVDSLLSLWQSIDRAAVFGRRRFVPLNLLRSRTLSSFAPLSQLIQENLVPGTFEDLAIPFAAIATDALTGEPELLTSGPLPRALMASAALPGIFPPVEIDSRPYVDGGVAANVPIRQAIAFGARSIVSLDATPVLVANRLPKSFLGSVLHSSSLMLRNQRSHAVDELAQRYPVAILPSATPPDMGSFNFDRTPELLEASYQLASEALDEWRTSAPMKGDW